MTEREPYDPADYQIQPLERGGELLLDSNFAKLVYEHGYTEIAYFPHTKEFWVKDMNVDEEARRRGVAQNVLRYTKELATNLGALTVRADIISRESLTAFQKVFGDQEEAIRIEKLGRYVDPQPGEPATGLRHTSAYLFYRIDRPSDTAPSLPDME